MLLYILKTSNNIVITTYLFWVSMTINYIIIYGYIKLQYDLKLSVLTLAEKKLTD